MGHVVSDAGIQTHPEKLEALKSFPVPKNVKEVGIFLGFRGITGELSRIICILHTSRKLLRIKITPDLHLT